MSTAPGVSLQGVCSI